MIEKDMDSPDSIIENVAKRIKDHAKQALNQEITIEDARTFAHKIAGANIPDEKERIATKMRAIIKKYQGC
ncbi:MAG: hypothetical protein NTW50_05020 [Candidatus Berkelbacteria bacterium]|nr:hypothetical protein [Candidatus Berkelbacteria bacterium]